MKTFSSLLAITFVLSSQVSWGSDVRAQLELRKDADTSTADLTDASPTQKLSLKGTAKVSGEGSIENPSQAKASLTWGVQLVAAESDNDIQLHTYQWEAGGILLTQTATTTTPPASASPVACTLDATGERFIVPVGEQLVFSSFSGSDGSEFITVKNDPNYISIQRHGRRSPIKLEHTAQSSGTYLNATLSSAWAMFRDHAPHASWPDSETVTVRCIHQ